MAKEICISSTPHETRLAILEDDQLAEIYYERENEYTLAGSIYNGRVTRVLPGMQSAFVDVGLERDAFLYVTDFLELEDQEEAEELEKAAASGGNQAPREVRHTPAPEQAVQSGRNGGRGGQRPDQKQEQRQDRQPRSHALSIETVPEAVEAAPAAPEPESARGESGAAQAGSGEGAKRWRGRRRRRGGRSGDREQSSPESQTETAEQGEGYPQASDESEIEPVIYASAASAPAPTPAPSPRTAHVPNASAPVPFVLPGESLSKYGGTPAGDAPEPSASSAAPVRPAATFKPSTLIEAPLEWDGSGLLPGESLSRHRNREPEAVTAEELEESGAAPDEIEEEEFVSERVVASPAAFAEQAVEATPEAVVSLEDEDFIAEQEELELEPAEDDFFEETTEFAHEPAAVQAADEPAPGKPTDAEEYEVEPVIDQPSVEDTVADAVVRQDESAPNLGSNEPLPADSGDEAHSAEFEADDSDASGADASASHHVDPAPHTGFRLFGLGSKKKKEEPAASPAPVATKAATVSSYAPGSGVIEEEVIEEEEFDAPHHHHKADEHDLEDYEEETLPNQIRSGALGEMLQEAHLDHKIQLKFEGKNGDDEEAFDEDEDDDDAVAADQSAAGQGQGAAQQPRDRGARGGRRGAPARPGQSNRGGRGPSRRSMQTSDLPVISDLLKPGQEILVQIAKEPIAKKGARITSHIALPGRFLVFMPTVSHVGVSRKIASDDERQRLKRILIHERGDASGGFIVRTAAEGASEEELRSDLRFLIHLWDEIKSRSDSSKSPALIYHDLSLIERILRDQVSTNFSSIWVDSQDDYERIVRFLNRFSPTLVRRVKLYTKETPLFEHFGIQDEISKALRSKVWLKSGGSIVINQTEALVAIDINTGKYVGKSARLEDTIVKTNLDAVPEIVRQIRLRDLGGIIVIDFIDMDERKNRFKVLAALEEALKADRAPTKVLQFNDFGLVAITRKRVKQSLERTLSVPCPTCQATGMVKSPITVCNEIYIELRKMKKHFEGADVLLRVNPETVKVLKSNNASWLTEFEELVGKNILVKSDATLHPEQFDIQG
ncbi:MAG: Rne/Rng family ribonuclease [Terriglobales bacterium]